MPKPKTVLWCHRHGENPKSYPAKNVKFDRKHPHICMECFMEHSKSSWGLTQRVVDEKEVE